MEIPQSRYFTFFYKKEVKDTKGIVKLSKDDQNKTKVYKIQHRKVKTGKHKSHYNPVLVSGSWEG